MPKQKQAIIVDQNLLWRLAASHILEAANYKVTPIAPSSTRHCLEKNANEIQLALIHISERFCLKQLEHIITHCRQHKIKLIMIISQIKLAALSRLYSMHPEGMISDNAIEQLVDALEANDNNRKYCEEQLQHMVGEYHYLLRQSPDSLQKTIEQSVFFNGSMLQCNQDEVDNPAMLETISELITAHNTAQSQTSTMLH